MAFLQNILNKDTQLPTLLDIMLTNCIPALQIDDDLIYVCIWLKILICHIFRQMYHIEDKDTDDEKELSPD